MKSHNMYKKTFEMCKKHRSFDIMGQLPNHLGSYDERTMIIFLCTYYTVDLYNKVINHMLNHISTIRVQPIALHLQWWDQNHLNIE